ncbi:gibberellin 3-beta-dioxygenase 1-like [Prosopis cineraria]|uniref:gibberellin 3-beta-dioxygenase 1-like n=1 Tax=Prosopis cineraria TaxID=364024 RepID=UPI0024108B5D|nr:gibberellin 3-beta-dioxygenase 1-like [Prosopis cineraria]
MAGDLSIEAAKNIPMDFSSAESLPDSHTWWSKGCSDIIDDGSVSIPVVDLTDPNAMETIKLACEEWGIFQLKNHGIPLSLLNHVNEEIKRLFSLPAEQKVKALRPPGAQAGYGSAYISPFFPKVMWHEGFTIVGSSYDDAKKVFTNHDDFARFSEKMEEIQKQLKNVVEKVTGMILNLLGVCDKEKKWVKSDNQTLQMNSYPSCPDPDRAIGLAQHKDTSIITILHQTQVHPQTRSQVLTQDQTGGLQIFKEGIGWVPVRPDPDAFVVHVGDILEILSNGKFTSVLHRVTVSRSAHRYSFAFFHRPSPESPLSPLHSHPRFRVVTLKEYDAIKAKDRPNALASISV